MGDIVLAGATSGTITLQPTAVAGSNTLTLPAANATVLTSTSPSSDLPSSINGPAFSAVNSGTQSLTGATTTKINFASEDYDTNNNYASSRFTPTVAGYYQITSFVNYTGSNFYDMYIYKNGANGIYLYGNFNSPSYYSFGTGLMYLNGTTDYAEIFVYTSGSVSANFARFQGVMVRGA